MLRVDSACPASREELSARIQTIRRRLSKAVTVFLTGMGLILVIFFCLVPVLMRPAPSPPAEPTWTSIALPLGTFAMVMLLAFVFDLWIKRIRDTLKCPKCRHAPEKNLDFAMTTGCCLECGANFIRDGVDSDEALSARSRQDSFPELAPQNRKVPSWKVMRPIVIWGIAGAITAGIGALIGIGLANYFQLMDVREYRNLVVGLCAIPGIPVAGFGLIKAIREEDKLRPCCPKCHRPFFSPLVVRWTGCCDLCGKQISERGLPPKRATAAEAVTIPLADFLVEKQTIQQKSNLTVAFGLITAAGWIGISMLLLWLIAVNSTNSQTLKWWGLLPALASSIQLVVTMIADFRISGRFKCPACRKRLYVNRFPITIATECCPECGVRILDRDNRFPTGADAASE